MRSPRYSPQIWLSDSLFMSLDFDSFIPIIKVQTKRILGPLYINDFILKVAT